MERGMKKSEQKSHVDWKLTQARMQSLEASGRSCHMSEGARNEKTELILTNKLKLLSQPCLT